MKKYQCSFLYLVIRLVIALTKKKLGLFCSRWCKFFVSYTVFKTDEHKSKKFLVYDAMSSGSRHSMAQEKLVEQTQMWQAPGFCNPSFKIRGNLKKGRKDLYVRLWSQQIRFIQWISLRFILRALKTMCCSYIQTCTMYYSFILKLKLKCYLQ